MKILTIANQKGGVGKTTIACHIAMQAISMDLKTMFIDLDIQANSSSFLSSCLKDDPTFAQTPTIELFTHDDFKCINSNIFLFKGTSDLTSINENLLKNWVNNIEKLAEYYDVCIIDTPPTVGLPQIAPMLICDYVLSPIELSSFSIDGASSMLTTLNNIQQQYNSKMKFLGLLPSRVNRNNNRQKTIYTDLINQFESYMYPNNMVIPERQAFADSTYLKQPIWQIKDHVAPKVSSKTRPVFLDIINRITNK